MSGDNRLSWLLARDGVIAAAAMDDARRRQAELGGALETALLELGFLTEEQVTEYLSQATQLPPAHRYKLYDYFDPRATQICPRELAVRFHVAPVSFEGSALRVLVAGTIERGDLEELATHIAAPLQPFVVPEFRQALILERLYGVTAPSRYVALAAALAVRQQVPPGFPARGVDRPRGAPSRPTGPLSSQSVVLPADRKEPERPPTVSDTPTISFERAPVSDLAPLAERPANVRARGSSGDLAPLEPPIAVEAVRRASGRDAILRALIRGVLSRTRYVAVLNIQGETALGHDALGAEGPDPDIGKVALNLPLIPSFRAAVVGGSAYVGPVMTRNPEVDAQLLKLGGTIPPTALLMPLVIKSRVVAVVYAHRGPAPVSGPDLGDVIPLGAEAATALARYISEAKPGTPGRGLDAPMEKGDKTDRTEKAEPPASDERRPRQRPPKQTARGSAVAPPPRTTTTSPAVPPVPRIATPIETPPAAPTPPPGMPLRADESRDGPRSIEEILRTIELGGPIATAAYDEAVRRADETLAALRRHFPGRIWLDPNGPVRPTRASDYGPIVALVVMLGKRAAPLLAELLASDSRDRRFYAALVAKEIGHPQLVYPLVARAFDHDPAVRAAAVEALAAYPAGETGRAFEQLRNALHGEAARARAAAQALRELRDASAVPDLIAALSFDRETAEEARRTLVVLTLQDHGARPKKWLAWWQKNQRRSRIEWMLDALGDRDREIRVAAGDELRRVTREDFGYHPDRPKPERDAARERWQKWWEQVGRRREISLRETPEDERTTLPPRHRPRDR